MFTLHYPEQARNYSEIDDFAYDIIYQKEMGQKTPKKLMALWRDGYNILTVRKNGGLLVAMGMLEASNTPKGLLKIEHIAVDPTFRQYGLGSLVVGTLVDYAQEAGARRVILKSVASAVGFYEKCGFNEIDNNRHVMRRDIV